jgi:hypothetical protein
MLLVPLIAGPLLLMGRCEPKSLEIRDELASLSGAPGLAWNGSQLVKIDCELDVGWDYAAIKYVEPVASAFIRLPGRILDEKPEYFLMRFVLNGEGNFIYGITVVKVLEVEPSPSNGFSPPILFFHQGKDRPDFLRVEVYNLKGAERNWQAPEATSDLIEFFTSDESSNKTRANSIDDIYIFEFRAVYATEGLVAGGTIGQFQLLAIIPYLGLMIFVPIGLLCLSKLKFRGLLNARLILPVGVALRVALSLFTSHAYDMEIWKFSVRAFYEHGEVALFSNWTSPPVFYFALISFYFPYALLHYFLGFSDWRFFHHPVRAVESSFIKMPMIIADVLIFLLLNKIMRHISPSLTEKQTIFLSSLYFLNPYVIMISSVWGMFDALAMVFIVAGIYMWLKERYLLAGSLFALSFCTKWIGIFPLLFGTILLLCSRRFSTVIKMATTSAGVILAIFALPYVVANQASHLLEVLMFRLGKGSNVVEWYGVTYLEYFRLHNVFDIFPDWFASNYFFIVFGVFGLILCAVIVKLNSRIGVSKEHLLIKSSLLACVIFYLAYHRINQQFLIWSIVLVPLLLSHAGNEAIEYPALGWVIVGMIPGMSSYLLFGALGPERFIRLLRPYEVGVSVAFSFLCVMVLWLFLRVNSGTTLLPLRMARVIKGGPKNRILVHILTLMLVMLLSIVVAQTVLADIGTYLALAFIILLFFVVAPFMAGVIECMRHDSKPS